MNKFKYIFYSIIIIGAFLLGTQTCKDTLKNDLQPIIDTLRIHTVDTIHDTTTVFKFKEKTVFQYVEVEDPFEDQHNEVRDNLILRKRYYTDTYKDTNLTVTINDSIIGYLTHRKVDYKLYVPLRIYDSTKTTITTQIPTLYKPKVQIRVGVLANQKSVNGLIDVQINKITYTGGYDPFNKRVSVGLKYTLFTK